MSAPKHDGGPAFPPHPNPNLPSALPTYSQGMTLRDWFAGQVIGELSVAPSLARQLKNPQPHEIARVLAGTAYAIADAMIAERSK